MGQNENAIDYDGGNGESTSILIGIVVAIILGIIIGGYAPEFAKHFDILGQIFLNSLKMIVVPLVVLSMIVGITGLGDIRNIGTIGGRTVLYYMATTAVSVIIGIIVVNIVRPGVGISTGERHLEFLYTLDDRTVNIGDESWDKKGFKNY
ncbi:MAG: cation:dicarboxylase symporter family transporter, partial [Candidatus Poribacteria bacterium]|nr:cation:dicarboxylase symporter family transporter [Candidatus Poribacteria bacterium]